MYPINSKSRRYAAEREREAGSLSLTQVRAARRLREEERAFINYLLRERRIGPLRVWSGVLGRLLLRIVGVVGPGLGAMRTAVSRAVDILVGVSLGRARPRRILFVSRTVADALETGGIPNWRRRWWRGFVSLIKREREAVESEALAVPNETDGNGERLPCKRAARARDTRFPPRKQSRNRRTASLLTGRNRDTSRSRTTRTTTSRARCH